MRTDAPVEQSVGPAQSAQTALPHEQKSAAGTERRPSRGEVRLRPVAGGVWIAFAVILLAAAGLRLYGLAALPFEQDELYTLRGVYRLGENFTIRPIYFVLQAAVLAVVPPSPLSMRALPFIFGVAGVALTWLLARRLFGTAAAHIAAVLVAISPWHLGASQFARYWTLIYLLAAVMLLALLRAYDRDRPRDYLLVFGIVVFGTLTHPTFLFPLAGIALGLHLVSGNGEFRFPSPSRAALLGLWGPLFTAALAGFYFLFVTDRMGAVRNLGTRGQEAALRLVPAMVQWATPEVVFAAIAGAAFLVVAGVTAVDRRWGAMALLGCAATIATMLGLSRTSGVYADYAMAMLPLVFVSIGGFVQRVSDLMRRSGGVFALGAGFLLVGGVLPGTVSHLSDGTRFDHRPAYAYIQSTGGQGLVLGEPIIIQRYYAPGLQFEPLRMSRRQLEQSLARTDGFWVVGSYRRYGMLLDEDGSVARWIENHCRKVMQTERPRFDYRTYRVELHWCGGRPAPQPLQRARSD